MNEDRPPDYPIIPGTALPRADQREEDFHPPAEIDAVLTDDARDLVRHVLKRNAPKPVIVEFTGFHGELFTLEFFERFRIETTIAEKMLHGKQNGEVASSPQDVRDRIKKTIASVTRNPDVKKYVRDLFGKRPDLGFGLDYHLILLDRFKKTYVIHEKCAGCNNTGKANCQACLGTGRQKCPRCQGTKEMICPTCRGMKFTGSGTQRKPCVKCRGRGRRGCTKCQRSGGVECVNCKRSGKVSCPQCSGTGWKSQMSYLTLRAKSLFDYDRHQLPPETHPLIDSLRGELVTEKHLQVWFNEDKIREEELNQIAKPEEFFIPYGARLPYGPIAFTLDGEAAEGTLFGFQPSLLTMPPFLEKTALPGLRALAEAALAPRDVRGHIKESLRYRIVGDALLAAAAHNPKMASEIMHRRYPFGIRSETLEQAVAHADTALKRMTRTSRYMGLTLGLTLAGALYAAYYIGPGRTLFDELIADKILLGVIDLLLIGIGGTLTTLSIQYTALGTLHRTLGKLAKNAKGHGKKKKFMPKAGTAAVIGYLGGLGIYLGILMFIAFGGGTVPPWFVAALKLTHFQ